ncbi:putative acetyltransferase [Chryseobacterium sp. H1D6B]|uniref:GNAT family N-acetyltransferase n=1 Tax=Chryseobacterium sp. H1D6B TaxID=2940588 RepID=UPI0015CD29C6|nr:GNAT family N-acetyltransferase [Chryseobacterium sp. H1D6B]MDH6250757.1 putative acetyltransferase [Chryseobacterium sp. H1D6B]
MIIRKGNIDDLAGLRRLFADTIINVCRSDYNDEQITVWSSATENIKRWESVLEEQFVLISEEQDQITGFCTLDKGNYIDLLFVHKDYLRQGTAEKLYTAVEQEAIRLNQAALTSDVSKTAKSFFEKMGFIVLKEQTVYVKDIEFINYKMRKTLS